MALLANNLSLPRLAGRTGWENEQKLPEITPQFFVARLLNEPYNMITDHGRINATGNRFKHFKGPSTERPALSRDSKFVSGYEEPGKVLWAESAGKELETKVPWLIHLPVIYTTNQKL